MIWALALPVGVVYLFWRFWLKRQLVCGGGKSPGHVVPSIATVLQAPDQAEYNVKDMNAPRVAGWTFRLLIWLAYTRIGRYFLVPTIKRNSNLHALDGLYIPEKPTLYPTQCREVTEHHSQANKQIINKLLGVVAVDGDAEFRFPSVADYVRAYSECVCTPSDVAETVLEAISHSDSTHPPLRAIVQTNRDVVLAQAAASTQRWKDNKTLSPLDGVPVAVKEELRVEPYEFRAGATFTPTISEGVPESAIVRKLLDAGAVIIGIANMHEFGTGTLGSNPNKDHLTARNPYNPQCYPGGSSSGSAASVAAGLCPIALGADGGGSVRIPAALCGIVGLKPTFRFLNSDGSFPQTYSVSVPGPLCSSVLDVAMAMDVMSDSGLSLDGLGEERLDGLTLGVYSEYFQHADPEIVTVCRTAVNTLESLGANIVSITIPELEQSRVAHSVSIMSEFSNALAVDVDKHFDKMNLESHLLLTCGYHFSSVEFLNAQKQRTRSIAVLKHLFEDRKIDAILTPATACTAPSIQPDSVKYGSVEAEVSGRLMRFAYLANLTGVPGLVVPVGYTRDQGLPIALQLMSAWHTEHTLLKIGSALEKTIAKQKPRIFYDVIKKKN